MVSRLGITKHKERNKNDQSKCNYNSPMNTAPFLQFVSFMNSSTVKICSLTGTNLNDSPLPIRAHTAPKKYVMVGMKYSSIKQKLSWDYTKK
jgi:hypothetical protein